MGNFYVNYTVRGPHEDAVVRAMADRLAIVTRQQAGCVVVFEQESERQDTSVIARLAGNLSGELRCPVLAVMNHDDDILWYQLYLNGVLADEYDSAPDYFDGDGSDPPAGPRGGNATKLCQAFGSSDVAEVEAILRKPGSDYVFAVDRHADLAGALGIPDFVVGAGYNYVIAGELPEGLEEDDLIRLP